MLTLGIFLDHLLSHFWRKSLSLSLKVICGGQGSELNSSCYCSSTFTHRVVSQALWDFLSLLSVTAQDMESFLW